MEDIAILHPKKYYTNTGAEFSRDFFQFFRIVHKTNIRIFHGGGGGLFWENLHDKQQSYLKDLQSANFLWYTYKTEDGTCWLNFICCS